MLVYVGSSGPPNSRVFIVGEAPGPDEEREGKPFVGYSGQELTRMLNEAGIARHDCRILNVSRYKPPATKKSNFDISEFISKTRRRGRPDMLPFRGRWVVPSIIDHVDELKREIETARPTTIIALGDTALWALTGKSGIGNWRGSILPCNLVPGPSVVATYHPSGILRTWEDRKDAVNDLRRAVWVEETHPTEPSRELVIRPTFRDVVGWLTEAALQSPFRLAVDIETRAGQILCIGLASGSRRALCIPFVQNGGENYWSVEEEFQIVRQLLRLLSSPFIRVLGQNFLYDAFYLAWRWHSLIIPYMDTLLVHHCCFPGTRKSLAYMASIYCDWYRFWKHDKYDAATEIKEWKDIPDEPLWTYNCLDCCYTFEVADALEQVLLVRGLTKQASTQMRLFEPTLAMMLRGIPVDAPRRSRMHHLVQQEIASRLAYLSEVFGHPVDPWATKEGGQLQKLFYHDFGLQPVLDKKTKRVSVGDESLDVIAQREPLLTAPIKAIREARSMRSLDSGVLMARGPQDRFYCSFNPAGTDTFRYSSSTNPFKWGTNLQNLPKPGAKGKAELPEAIGNPRALIIPDPGYFLIEADLQRADLYIVVWEAGDEALKKLLREGGDFHANTAKEIGVNRDFAKQFIHMINYGARPRTVGMTLRISTALAERHRTSWFSKHPGILEWHYSVDRAIRSGREIQNAFGYKRPYFGRIDEHAGLPEALAWIPQSTVAICTNLGFLAIEDDETCQQGDTQILAHWHDALFLQARIEAADLVLPAVRRCMSVVVPYLDPLVIPVDLKISLTNQAEMLEVKPPCI